MKQTSHADPAREEAAGVQSVEVGLRLLKPLIEKGGALSLKAISDAAGFAAPKAHRYLVSLIRAGLVERSAQSGSYALGPLAVELGLAALGQIDKEGLGREAIKHLADQLEITSCLLIWLEGKPVLVAIEPATAIGSIYISIRLGSKLPVTQSASGLIFLSYMRGDHQSQALRTAAAAEGQSVRELSARIRDVRTCGVATVEDQVMPGMSGLAVPVFDHNGDVVFTLAALGPTPTFDSAVDGPVAHAFQEQAFNLSRKFGWSNMQHP